MAALEDRITVNPKQCGGRPCIRGMRIRVSDVLDILAAGLSQEEILAEHPDVETEDIEACLRLRKSTARSSDRSGVKLWIDHQLSPYLTG